MSDQEEPVIAYSLREILAAMDRKLDLITGLVHGKADNSRVDQIDDRLRMAEKALEHHQKSADEKRRGIEWLVPVALTAVIIVITVIQLYRK